MSSSFLPSVSVLGKLGVLVSPLVLIRRLARGFVIQGLGVCAPHIPWALGLVSGTLSPSGIVHEHRLLWSFLFLVKSFPVPEALRSQVHKRMCSGLHTYKSDARFIKTAPSLHKPSRMHPSPGFVVQQSLRVLHPVTPVFSCLHEQLSLFSCHNSVSACPVSSTEGFADRVCFLSKTRCLTPKLIFFEPQDTELAILQAVLFPFSSK